MSTNFAPQPAGGARLHAMAATLGIVLALLTTGCLPSAQPPRKSAADATGGPTPLSLAVWAGDLARVRSLLADGADPLARESGANAPWLWAVVARDREALAMLLAAAPRDASLEIPATNGLSLRYAAGIGDRELVREMLRRGSRPDERMDGRATALAIAAANGDLAMVELLLAAGASSDPVDAHGDTAFMAAVRDGSTDVVRLLLSRGANANRRDRAGRSAVDWARSSGRDDLVALLGGEPLQPSPPRAHDARAAVAASVPLLQRGMTSWTQATECASCHHTPMMVRVLAAADHYAIDYDKQAANDFVVGLREDERRFRTMLAMSLKTPDGVLHASTQNGGDFAHTLALLGASLIESSLATPTSDMARVLVAIQRPAGHWRHGPSRIPIESSDIATTANAVRVLRQLAPDETARARDRAARWLRAQKPETLDDAAYHLLGLRWTDSSADEVAAATRTLVEWQAANGGWAHRRGRTPDAYATGLALWALHQSGMAASDPVYRRGIVYLVSTQEPDGSWLVHTRAVPILPHVESGFPHGKFQFVSYAGTAWATLPLMPTLAGQAPK